MRQDQETGASLYQEDQVQSKTKNQIGASRAGGTNGEPELVGDLVVAAVREAFEKGPGLAEARMHRAILETCPELATSWAPRYVAKLVALGEIPPADVQHALNDFLAQEQRARLGAAPPIRSRSAYASSLLKKCLARHGFAWRKPVERRA